MEQEKNEGSSPLQETKDQNLKSNEQESPNDKSMQLSPEEANLRNIGVRRMIFLALLDASMRYREGYFREDIEQYIEHLENGRNFELQKTKDKLLSGMNLNERAWHRAFDKRVETLVVNYKLKQEQFNRTAYKKVEEIVEQMGASFKYNFDNYATGFGLLAEEFIKAKNTTELLTVCKLYNQGLMESTFAEIRKQRENEKTSSIDESRSDINDGSINGISVMQEEQTARTITGEDSPASSVE